MVEVQLKCCEYMCYILLGVNCLLVEYHVCLILILLFLTSLDNHDFSSSLLQPWRVVRWLFIILTNASFSLLCSSFILKTITLRLVFFLNYYITLDVCTCNKWIFEVIFELCYIMLSDLLNYFTLSFYFTFEFLNFLFWTDSYW